MKLTDINDWLKQEFADVQLATNNDTITQIIANAVRYWNTHSGFKYVKMIDLSNMPIEGEQIGTADGTSLTYTLNTTFSSVIQTSGVEIRVAVQDKCPLITDDGHGVLSGDGGNITGTINYGTGAISLTFTVAPNLNAIFFINYNVSASYGNPPGSISPGSMIPVTPEFKLITQVYPAVTPQLLWQDNTLWKLFGTTILDNVTSDLIMMTQAFQNYQLYVGTDFRWTFEMAEDPSQYGRLYWTNNPITNSLFCLVGAKRIMPNEDIKSDHILYWLLYYAKALLKMCEGNMLRKADIINVKNDGQTLYDEGKEEKEALEKQLAEEGRWLALAQRF